ncbi:MAG: radical SAM/SPASM domain-containing protein [Promethearchaeota archaeon]
MKKKFNLKEIKQYKSRQISRLVVAAKRAKDRGGKPFIFHFLTTLKCNCGCEICFWKNNSVKNELSFDEIKRIYLEAKNAGFLVSILWGGEPTLRKDITEIIRFAKKEAMEAVDIINVDYPLISLQFSFSISKYNIHRVDQMIDLGDKLDVPVAFNVINTMRHYSTGIVDEKEDLAASDKEISNAFSRILEAKKNSSRILCSEMYLKHFIGGKKPYRCHAKKVFMFVNSNGDIENCLQLDNPIANLRKHSVAEVLDLPRFKQFMEDTENCCTCNSPTMIDTSYIWEDFSLFSKNGGISLG